MTASNNDYWVAAESEINYELGRHGNAKRIIARQELQNAAKRARPSVDQLISLCAWILYVQSMPSSDPPAIGRSTARLCQRTGCA